MKGVHLFFVHLFFKCSFELSYLVSSVMKRLFDFVLLKNDI